MNLATKQRIERAIRVRSWRLRFHRMLTKHGIPTDAGAMASMARDAVETLAATGSGAECAAVMADLLNILEART